MGETAKQECSSFQQSNNNYTRIVKQRRKKLKLSAAHKKLIVYKSGLAAAAATERRMQSLEAVGARLNFSPLVLLAPICCHPANNCALGKRNLPPKLEAVAVLLQTLQSGAPFELNYVSSSISQRARSQLDRKFLFPPNGRL